MLSAGLGSTRASAGPRAGEEVIACHECGLVHRLPPLPEESVALCRACGAAVLRRPADPVDRPLALYLGALLLFLVASSFPILTLALEGQGQASTILDGAVALHRAGMWPIAAVVLATGTLLPLAKIAGMLLVLVPLRLGLHPPWLSPAFRWVERLHPWAMMEVYLLGLIVAYVKLSDLAEVEVGIALYAFVGTILLMAAGDAAFDPHAIWRRLAPQAGPEVLRPQPGTVLVSCHRCDQLLRLPVHGERHDRCPRCAAPLHKRKPDSVARTSALALTAAILYLPANVYPVMTVTYFGQGEPDTILSGVIALFAAGMWPVALLVFFASVTVPVLKLLGLAYLLVSIQRRWTRRARDRTRLYRIIEGVGRWSMVDVFMIAILTALVSLGNIASIEPGVGAVAFCAVVILTMLASMSFDPRLIWDVLDERHGSHRPPRA